MNFQNESAVSFNWLKEQTGLTNDLPGQTSKIWDRIKKQMREVDQIVVSSQDWVSDYWLCKGFQVNTHFAAKWMPPDNLDEWSTAEVKLKNTRPTNHSRFLKILSEGKVEAQFTSDDALQKFILLDKSTQIRGDVAMHQSQYIRAWLFTALGPLLMSIPLSPQINVDELSAETLRRLYLPKRFNRSHWGVFFSEAELEILYNCRISPNGNLTISKTQVGQGDEWMKHWQWLSEPIIASEALTAVQLAAMLLRSSPLIKGLLKALESKDTYLEELAITVIRRWLLALKAMTWLENALKCSWKFVRPQDLACLAFNALKPEWPRRLISVSHRSFEVKPLLQETRAWNSPLFAIDAVYVPAWETNTGMIWGLFANTPVITIVDSSNYSASEWCQREAELIRHLELECDFRSKRYVRTLKPEEVTEFSNTDEDWYINNAIDYDPELNLFTSFPPLSNVFVPLINQEWEVYMLQAAGALRVFNASYADPKIVNILLKLLINDNFVPPFFPPTNQPNGWEDYKKIFHNLSSEFDGESLLHLWLPQGFPVLNPDETQKFLDRIPDLSTGNPALGDIMIALEWMQSLLPVLEAANLGDMILIDLRGVTKEDWEHDSRYSLARGIASLRQPPMPVWFIQYDGQKIEKWGLLGGDRPIFTQHTEKQYNWMWEGYFSSDWPDVYADKCGLEMSKEIKEKCWGTRLRKKE